MKLSSTRLPVALLTGAILAFVHSTFAADRGDCLSSAAAMAATTPAAGPPSPDQIAAASPALTLFIKAPTGDKLRLAYVPDEGWNLLEDPRGANVAAVAASASAMQATSAVEKPLTVFIDGPTGYTYIWMPDEGWKFVGHIIDQKQ